MKKILFIVAFSVSIFANDVVIKESNHSVTKTIKNIKDIVTKKGLRVFTVINHQAGAKKAGLKMREAKVIIFGNPKMGTKLMNNNIVSGLDLPMKILVYKDVDKKVKLAYRDGAWLKKEHDLKLDKLTTKVDNVLNKITNKAIK